MPSTTTTAETTQQHLETPERSPSVSSLRVKTSGDWMSLFLGSNNNSDNSNHQPDKSKMYERSYSLRSSYSGSGSGSTSYGSRYYSSAASSYLSSSSSSRFNRSITNSSPHQSPYVYRSRISREEEEEQKAKAVAAAAEAARNNNNNNESDVANGNVVKNGKSKKPTTVMNGNVIRLNRNRQVIESSEEESESEEEESEESPPEVVVVTPPAPPPPPPEDPLDVEERMLNAQLTLSLTLTLTDEETIRQRLLEIKKTRIRRSGGSNVEKGLIERFEKESEELTEASRAKEEEERILINRLKAESIREVEQKDIQVRLQELFRDRKSSLEVTQKNMETHYEHMLQETSTETTELDASIRGKQMQIERLQDEILSMTVRKELLSHAMEKVNHRHIEQLEQLGCQRTELEAKMSQYAVLAPPPIARKSSPSADSEQLKELEQELECPICMDIARPPIYQCEEGHIICSTCKPLLTTCPHCSKSYSNPVIRCRFAEKLSEKYFKLVAEQEENLMQ